MGIGFTPEEEDALRDQIAAMASEDSTEVTEVEATDEVSNDDTETEDSHPEEVETSEDAVDEVEDEVDEVEAGDAETDGETKDAEVDTDETAIQEEPQLYTVKVNGEELQVPLEELTRGYQTMRAANEKFEAAARIEKESAPLIEFAQQFDAAFQEDPASLLAEYVELMDDPNQVILAMVERSAALGKLHPQLVELFGIDDTYVAKAEAQMERARRERLENERVAETAEQVDPYGYTASQYNEIANELIAAAGLESSDDDTKLNFIRQFSTFRTENNIANPYIAFARWAEHNARLEAEAAKAEAAKAAAAVSAAKKAAKPKQRIPGAAATGGQIAATSEVTSAPIADHYEAAKAAFEKVFGN